MAKVKCTFEECLFNENGICQKEEIELDSRVLNIDCGCPDAEWEDEVEEDDPTQEEPIRMAWCKGFNAGVEYAKKSISLYIKEMGYAYEIPKAHELY